MIRYPMTVLLALAGGLCFAGTNGATGDMVDPISSLGAGSIDTVTLTLNWYAPMAQNFYGAYGDGPNGDGSFPADGYELRQSTTAVSGASNWASMAPAAAGLPSPGQPGDLQTTSVSGLSQGKDYWFLIRVAFHDTYDFSNVLHVKTITDSVAPTAINGLAVTRVSEETVTLAWTATGDDNGTGTATQTELRYSTTGPILTSNDFDSATPVTSMPEPQAGGASEAKLVGGLAPTTTYWFSIRAVDEVGNMGPLAQATATTMTPVPSSGGNGGGCGGSAPGSTILLAAAILLITLPLARR